jgi:hypothetical protein
LSQRLRGRRRHGRGFRRGDGRQGLRRQDVRGNDGNFRQGGRGLGFEGNRRLERGLRNEDGYRKLAGDGGLGASDSSAPQARYASWPGETISKAAASAAAVSRRNDGGIDRLSKVRGEGDRVFGVKKRRHSTH